MHSSHRGGRRWVALHDSPTLSLSLLCVNWVPLGVVQVHIGSHVRRLTTTNDREGIHFLRSFTRRSVPFRTDDANSNFFRCESCDRESRAKWKIKSNSMHAYDEWCNSSLELAIWISVDFLLSTAERAPYNVRLVAKPNRILYDILVCLGFPFTFRSFISTDSSCCSSVVGTLFSECFSCGFCGSNQSRFGHSTDFYCERKQNFWFPISLKQDVGGQWQAPRHDTLVRRCPQKTEKKRKTELCSCRAVARNTTTTIFTKALELPHWK